MTMADVATLPYPIPPTWQGTSPSHDCTMIHTPNYIPPNSSNVRIPKHPPYLSKITYPGGIYFFV